MILGILFTETDGYEYKLYNIIVYDGTVDNYSTMRLLCTRWSICYFRSKW